MVLAEGHTGPLSWSGQDEKLPAGIDDALHRIVAERRAGAPVDTLCALAAEVAPDARQRGLAGELLGGMRELGGRQRLRRLIAPVRPVLEGALSARADRALRLLAAPGRPAA